MPELLYHVHISYFVVSYYIFHVIFSACDLLKWNTNLVLHFPAIPSRDVLNKVREKIHSCFTPWLVFTAYIFLELKNTIVKNSDCHLSCIHDYFIPFKFLCLTYSSTVICISQYLSHCILLHFHMTFSILKSGNCNTDILRCIVIS